MRLRLFSALLAFSSLSLSLNAAPLPKGSGKVEIKEEPGKLRIEVGGKFFSEYVYENTSRPYLYPIIGPTGAGMTRNWPMKEVEGEERDHVHHKGLWYTHGDVNGIDFWAEAKESGTTVHDGFVEVKSGDVGLIKSKNKLVAKGGKVVATDVRTFKIYNVKDAALIDFEYTLTASNGEVTFGDTKEGTMAIRLAETMKGKKPGQGHIVNSEGIKDADTWGKRAKWVDYYGPVEGKTVGVAMFDHPSNPRYPTWWHVRDYGLFAANPFGLHDFEKKEKGAGNMTVKAGDSVTFRYRFYFHKGNEVDARVEEQYREYVK
jgi:hypothetical protein